MAKASSVFVGCSKSMCDPSDGSPRRAVDLGKKKERKGMKSATNPLHVFRTGESDVENLPPLDVAVNFDNRNLCWDQRGKGTAGQT